MKGQEREREGGNEGREGRREGRRKVRGRRKKERLLHKILRKWDHYQIIMYIKRVTSFIVQILHACKKFKDAPHIYSLQITRINHSS